MSPKAHYHVIENTPGYLPESEPATFTNKREAGQYAYSLARELREAGYSVSGNQSDGYYGEMHSNDLGRVIEITECQESDCADNSD